MVVTVVIAIAVPIPVVVIVVDVVVVMRMMSPLRAGMKRDLDEGPLAVVERLPPFRYADVARDGEEQLGVRGGLFLIAVRHTRVDDEVQGLDIGEAIDEPD